MLIVGNRLNLYGIHHLNPTNLEEVVYNFPQNIHGMIFRNPTHLDNRSYRMKNDDRLIITNS